MRGDIEQVERARRLWQEFSAGRDLSANVDAVLDDVVRYLESGLEGGVVATILRLRSGQPAAADEYDHRLEVWHLKRERADLERMVVEGRLAPDAQAAVDRVLATRLAMLNEAGDPLPPRIPPSAAPAPAPRPAKAAATAATGEPTPAPPPPSLGISLRELVADHSVVILAALGAFLLVVATVLFELYATTALAGVWRLLAVVALDAVFATAGYLAIGRERLRAVGQIYIALAAVLLPLSAVAAWNFLELHSRGITVDQALAVTGAACAAVYGLLALRLGLLAYAELAGAAILVAAWGAAGALVGAEWRSAALAAAPLIFGAVRRAARSPEFRHFEWFGHASAAVAVVVAVTMIHPPHWLPTVTFAVLAAGYLAWQAVEPSRLHAWPGEALAVIASLLLVEEWGVVSYRYLLPFGLAAAFVLLRRREHWFGAPGRLYRPHALHLHLAVAAGLVISAANTPESVAWHLVAGAWAAAALYAADYALQPNATAGYLVRVAVPFALLATAEAAHLHAWSGAVVAVSLLAYSAPMAPRLAAPLLTQQAPVYVYGVLPLIAIELRDATVAPGQWSVPTALAVAGVGFGLAAELGRVPMAGLTGRALVGGAWFLAVEALDLVAWRGPADALLALAYTAIAQLRAAANHPAAVEARRSLVHVTSATAVALCFAGPADQLWWRLAAALAIVAVGYWWQASRRPDAEAAPIAWAALAGSAAALVIAVVPHELQGTAVAVAAVALTVAWWLARRLFGPGRLATAAFPVLGTTAALGAILVLRQAPPTWPQAATALVLASFLLAWRRMRVEVPEIQEVLRPGAALLAVGAGLLAAGVIRLEVPATGLAIVVVAAGHAGWALRGGQEAEQWYAVGATMAAPAVLFVWPFGDPLPGVVAVEFLAAAALIALTGAGRRLPMVAGAAVVACVPAVHLLVLAAGLTRTPAPEEAAMAALAWGAGVAGVGLRSRAAPPWAWSVEGAAAGIAAIVVIGALAHGDKDLAGTALLAYSPVIFTAGVQESQPAGVVGAVAICVAGVFTLLADHRADTLLYPAALAVVGLSTWVAVRLFAPRIGARDPSIDAGRLLGIALLVAAGASGFAFPDRTGAGSIGAALAMAAFLVAAGILVFDARFFGLAQNLYAGLLLGSAAGFFAAREAGLPEWELGLPGVGLVACAVLLRQESRFHMSQRARQAGVAAGALLAMGWAIAQTLAGGPSWMVVLLVEGALMVPAGMVLRSRVLLACGAAAVALVSLRALLAIAQAGYLFVAFGLAALVLLVAASGLALGRDRFTTTTRGLREQLGQWD